MRLIFLLLCTISLCFVTLGQNPRGRPPRPHRPPQIAPPRPWTQPRNRQQLHGNIPHIPQHHPPQFQQHHFQQPHRIPPPPHRLGKRSFNTEMQNDRFVRSPQRVHRPTLIHSRLQRARSHVPPHHHVAPHHVPLHSPPRFIGKRSVFIHNVEKDEENNNNIYKRAADPQQHRPPRPQPNHFPQLPLQPRRIPHRQIHRTPQVPQPQFHRPQHQHLPIHNRGIRSSMKMYTRNKRSADPQLRPTHRQTGRMPQQHTVPRRPQHHVQPHHIPQVQPHRAPTHQVPHRQPQFHQPQPHLPTYHRGKRSTKNAEKGQSSASVDKSDSRTKASKLSQRSKEKLSKIKEKKAKRKERMSKSSKQKRSLSPNTKEVDVTYYVAHPVSIRAKRSNMDKINDEMVTVGAQLDDSVFHATNTPFPPMNDAGMVASSVPDTMDEADEIVTSFHQVQPEGKPKCSMCDAARRHADIDNIRTSESNMANNQWMMQNMGQNNMNFLKRDNSKTENQDDLAINESKVIADSATSTTVNQPQIDTVPKVEVQDSSLNSFSNLKHRMSLFQQTMRGNSNLDISKEQFLNTQVPSEAPTENVKNENKHREAHIHQSHKLFHPQHHPIINIQMTPVHPGVHPSPTIVTTGGFPATHSTGFVSGLRGRSFSEVNDSLNLNQNQNSTNVQNDRIPSTFRESGSAFQQVNTAGLEEKNRNFREKLDHQSEFMSIWGDPASPQPVSESFATPEMQKVEVDINEFEKNIDQHTDIQQHNRMEPNSFTINDEQEPIVGLANFEETENQNDPQLGTFLRTHDWEDTAPVADNFLRNYFSQNFDDYDSNFESLNRRSENPFGHNFGFNVHERNSNNGNEMEHFNHFTHHGGRHGVNHQHSAANSRGNSNEDRRNHRPLDLPESHKNVHEESENMQKKSGNVAENDNFNEDKNSNERRNHDRHDHRDDLDNNQNNFETSRDLSENNRFESRPNNQHFHRNDHSDDLNNNQNNFETNGDLSGNRRFENRPNNENFHRTGHRNDLNNNQNNFETNGDLSGNHRFENIPNNQNFHVSPHNFDGGHINTQPSSIFNGRPNLFTAQNSNQFFQRQHMDTESNMNTDPNFRVLSDLLMETARDSNISQVEEQGPTVSAPYLFQVPRQPEYSQEDFNRNAAKSIVRRHSLNTNDNEKLSEEKLNLKRIIENERHIIESLKGESPADPDLLVYFALGENLLNEFDNKLAELLNLSESELLANDITDNRMRRSVDNNGPTRFTLNLVPKSRQTRETYKHKTVKNDRPKRAIPLERLLTDPKVKLDMDKTLQNLGVASRRAVEDERAPLYHMRNLLGSTKNTLLSAIRIPPQNLVIPSNYRINRIDDEDEFVGQKNPGPNHEIVGAENYQEGFQNPDTFQRVGAVFKESVQSTRKTLSHATDIVNDGRNIVLTARHATPRLISPFARSPTVVRQRLAPPTPNLLNRLGTESVGARQDDRTVILAPRVVHIHADSKMRKHPIDSNPDFVKMEQLLDALGVSDGQPTKLGLERIIIQQRKETAPSISINDDDLQRTLENPLNDIVGSPQTDNNRERDLMEFNENELAIVGDTLTSLEEAKKSVGARNLRELILNVRNGVLGSPRRGERKSKKTKRRKYKGKYRSNDENEEKNTKPRKFKKYRSSKKSEEDDQARHENIIAATNNLVNRNVKTINQEKTNPKFRSFKKVPILNSRFSENTETFKLVSIPEASKMKKPTLENKEPENEPVLGMSQPPENILEVPMSLSNDSPETSQNNLHVHELKKQFVPNLQEQTLLTMQEHFIENNDNKRDNINNENIPSNPNIDAEDPHGPRENENNFEDFHVNPQIDLGSKMDEDHFVSNSNDEQLQAIPGEIDLVSKMDDNHFVSNSNEEQLLQAIPEEIDFGSKMDEQHLVSNLNEEQLQAIPEQINESHVPEKNLETKERYNEDNLENRLVEQNGAMMKRSANMDFLSPEEMGLNQQLYEVPLQAQNPQNTPSIPREESQFMHTMIQNTPHPVRQNHMFIDPSLLSPFMGLASNNQMKNFFDETNSRALNEKSNTTNEKNEVVGSSQYTNDKFQGGNQNVVVGRVYFQNRDDSSNLEEITQLQHEELMRQNDEFEQSEPLLGAINPIMFQEFFNETLEIRKPTGSNNNQNQHNDDDDGKNNHIVGTSMAMYGPLLEPFYGQASRQAVTDLLDSYTPPEVVDEVVNGERGSDAYDPGQFEYFMNEE